MGIVKVLGNVKTDDTFGGSARADDLFECGRCLLDALGLALYFEADNDRLELIAECGLYPLGESMQGATMTMFYSRRVAS